MFCLSLCCHPAVCVPKGSAWANPGWSLWDPPSSGFSVPQVLREESAPGRFWLDVFHAVCCPPASSVPISLDSSGNHAVESKSLRAGRRNSSTKPRTAQDPAGTVISGDRCAHGVLKAEQKLQYYFIPVDMQIFVHQTPLFRVLPWVLCSYSLKKQENIGFQGNIRGLQSKWSIFESQTWTWWSKTRKGPETNNPQSKKEHYQSPYIFK